jgi:hypothetical protein
MDMEDKPKKFYWSASTSSGGTLSLSLHYEGALSKKEKEQALAHGFKEAHKHMEEIGYIPFKARLMSSSDIAEEYGKTRQYWEKLLNEGKILYKETAAGRITTDVWINGYIGKKEEVDGYVKNVKEVLETIAKAERKYGSVRCPVCGNERFEYHVNANSNVNGICRACGFHIHTLH